MSQELSMLPMRVRNEIAVAKLVDKIRFMPSHPLQVSCARPTIINKERSKWLIKCKDIYRKFAPRIDARAVEVVEVIKAHAPWDMPSIIHCINHTVSKLTSTNKELKSVEIQDIQKLPVGLITIQLDPNQIREQQLHSSSTKKFHA